MKSIAVLLLFVSVSAIAQVRYNVVQLVPNDPIIGSSAAQGINSHGDGVGSFFEPGSPVPISHAFLYSTQNGYSDLGYGPGGIRYVSGINNTGQISGYGTVDGSGYFHALLYTPGGGFTDLGTLGGRASETHGINNSGQVVGFAEDGNLNEHAFRYTAGVMVDLGTLSGPASDARGINDLGWVTGISGGRAFIYKDGVGMTDIGPGSGWAINNAGVVAGESPSTQPVIYVNGQTIPLGGIGTARGINNSNIVVGADLSGFERAFVWSEQEGIQDLNTLIDANTGWYLAVAAAINDNGQIVGWGYGPERGPLATPFRLDPVFPIVITNQPADQFVFAGQDASLTVGATGTTPAYQWRFNDAPIPGATNSTLSFPVRSSAQAGGYSVVISNLVNVVTSSVATLTVYGYQFTATFTGGNEVPANRSAHTGIGIFTLNSNVLSYVLGLDFGFYPTSAKIYGAASTIGPHHLIADLGGPAPIFPGPSNLPGVGTANYTGHVALNERQLRELLAGRLFVNSTSARFPLGELRGAILPSAPVQFSATLSGTNEVPRNPSAHHGGVQLTLTGNHLAYTLALDTNFTWTSAGIFGPVGPGAHSRHLISNLDTSGGVLSGDQMLYTGALDLNDLEVRQLKRGRLFLNVLTAPFPHGELRGQIQAVDDDQNGVRDFIDAYVTQLCPCDGQWADHAQYLQAVHRSVFELAAAQLVTGPELRRVLEKTRLSDCGEND